jgi:hypothetical protein
MITMSAIRDDGFNVAEPLTYEGADDFFTSVTYWAKDFRLDRQRGQEQQLVLWCEASGMVSQLERLADPWGVPVYSSGGFDSLTDKHKVDRLASTLRLRQQVDAPPEVRSNRGKSLRSIRPSKGVYVLVERTEDPLTTRVTVAKMQHCDPSLRPLLAEPIIRLAINREQAQYYRLESAPPKRGANRHAAKFVGEDTWQLEALAPDDLAAIVRDAIISRFDDDTYQGVLAEEEEIKEQILRRLRT